MLGPRTPNPALGTFSTVVPFGGGVVSNLPVLSLRNSCAVATLAFWGTGLPFEVTPAIADQITLRFSLLLKLSKSGI